MVFIYLVMMIHDLVVFNSSNSSANFPEVLNRLPWMNWSTCVREMRIGFRDWLTEDLAAVQGREAYEFLLEVICGLHSPMLGETEVFGQFRERVLKNEEHPRIAKLGLNLISDAKKIRENYLTNLGANSYGSLTRKHTKNHPEVSILGAGMLAREILPWMKDKTAVKVYTRDPEKRLGVFANFKNVGVLKLDSRVETSAVVVAAPVGSDELHLWLDNKNIRLVIDLRETSSRDPLTASDYATVVLQDLFLELNSNQDQIRQRIGSAREAIRKISEERLKTQELRPFGWDDICA